MSDADSLDPAAGALPQTPGTRSACWLVLIVYVLSALAFVLDLRRDDTLAYGIIYTPLVATAVFYKARSGPWILCAIACAMVTVGAFLPMVASDLPDLIGNRFLSIVAVIATAAFVHQSRSVQERLAAETRRAEDAERIKTEVLTSISQEIRTPFQTLLGVLTLTMAASKPDQRAALARVRSDGKELLATIDNLLDLTQIDDRGLQRQTVDISRIARDAAESVREAAKERQINIALSSDRESGKASAIGNSWALRRILDNLLANAVRLTPPGGTVSVSVAQTDRSVTASISDTGKGLPPGLTQAFHDDADGEALPEEGLTGLALSRRLARAMNGKMTASNEPGPGATVSLTLPAA